MNKWIKRTLRLAEKFEGYTILWKSMCRNQCSLDCIVCTDMHRS